MSNGGHDDDDIPITKSKCWPGMVAAAVVGGVAGFLICQFVSEKDAVDCDYEQDRPAAIHQPHETPDRVA